MIKGFLTVAFSLALGGCFQKFGANSTVAVGQRASPAVNTIADPNLVEDAIPYSLVQNEGLLVVIPNNITLRISLMRTYGSFGYAFMEDRMEQAEGEDDEARMEHYRNRASLAYLRARTIGFETMTLEEDANGGAQGAFSRGIDAWKEYLRRFDDDEQTPIVFWTGYNMARYIGLNKDNPDVLADLPYALACFERALELNHTFFDYAPHAAMGSYYSRASAALGGDPVAARREFELIVNQTQRKNLGYLVLYARTYAVMVQDRALFRQLLQEVIDAGDVDPAQRLPNQIAKRRAVRYLAQIDNLFGPEEPAGENTPTPDAAPADGAAPAAPAN
jgi:hypothetical protein